MSLKVEEDSGLRTTDREKMRDEMRAREEEREEARFRAIYTDCAMIMLKG